MSNHFKHFKLVIDDGKLSLDIEGWFEFTTFEVDHHHPGSGEEFHIDVKICTEFQGSHDIKLQLNETNARNLRNKLTTALKDCYCEREQEHEGPT